MAKKKAAKKRRPDPPPAEPPPATTPGSLIPAAETRPALVGAGLRPPAVKQAILWLIEGNQAEDVHESLREHYPDADADQVLQKASDHFYDLATSDREVVLGWALEATRELYRRMVDAGDYAGARTAINDLVRHAKQLEPRDDDHTPTEDL